MERTPVIFAVLGLPLVETEYICNFWNFFQWFNFMFNMATFKFLDVSRKSLIEKISA